MRDRRLVFVAERNPREYRLGLEFKPVWANAFGAPQRVFVVHLGSLSFRMVWFKSAEYHRTAIYFDGQIQP